VFLSALVILGCGSPSSSPAERVVLVTVDTLRADHLGSYGARNATTPILDTIAESGVRFDSAISPAPLTLPAHTTLMTALEPPEHGVRHNSTFRLGSGIPTLAESMQDAGFATAAVVGAVVLDRRFGLDRGFEFYDDAISGRASATVGFAERSADTVVDRALSWLERAPDRFFLWVHFYDPHADYAPPAGFAAAFARRPYDGEVAFVDAQLGRLIAALDERWPDGKTLLIVTSDHGESLGEHGESTHAYTIYGATQRIPLLVRGPGVPHGKVVTEPVGLVDVAPTVLALAGARPLPDIRGRDLTPAWLGATFEPREIYAESMATHLDYGWSPLWGLRTGRYQYIRAPRRELYDLRNDPGETQNVARRHPEVAARLETLLTRRLAAGPRAESGLSSPLDEEERARLQSLGYVVPESGAALRRVPIDVEGPDPKDEIGVLAVLGEAQRDIQANRLKRALRRLAAIRGGGTAVPALRAAILVATGDFASAEAHARLVLAAEPDRPDLWIVLGRALAGQSRIGEARFAFERAARLEPGSLEAQTFLGGACQELGHSDEAIRAFERARQIDPTSAEPNWRLATLYFNRGSRDEATAILQDLAAEGVPLAPAASARVVLAEARAGNLDAARKRLAAARLKHPEDPDLARVFDALEPL